MLQEDILKVLTRTDFVVFDKNLKINFQNCLEKKIKARMYSFNELRKKSEEKLIYLQKIQMKLEIKIENVKNKLKNNSTCRKLHKAIKKRHN